MDKQMIISIGRQCGSGGYPIGRMLAEHYGIKLYDRSLIDLLAEDMDKDADSVARMEERISGLLPKRKGGFDAKVKDLMNRLSKSDEMYLHERGLIERLGETESFVIVGRGANDVLASHPNALRIFIYAPEEFKIPFVKENYNILTDAEAKKRMEMEDKSRREYYEYYTGRTWGGYDPHHLMIDSSLLGLEGTAQLIISVADKKFGL
ncbi:MAG: cytidylate kinase-like family protein [Oscillospiraceae bacterium]|nr:cytidylate kinase-like family protein [Oscillospiraceae bacterium]